MLLQKFDTLYKTEISQNLAEKFQYRNSHQIPKLIKVVLSMGVGEAAVEVKTGKILYSDEIDSKYHSVCVEHTNFAPISFDDVMIRIKNEGGVVGFKNGNT